MTKRPYMAALALAVVVAMLLLPISAMAGRDDVLNVSAKCRLTLNVPAGMTALKNPSQEVPISIYRIADMNADGTYTSIAPFEDVAVPPETVDGNGAESADRNKSIVNAAMPIIRDGLAAPASGAPTSLVGGSATFEDAAAGVYVVVPRNVDIDGYSFIFQPSVVPLPAMVEDGPGDTGHYGYTVTADLKVEMKDLMGPVTVRKTLSSYDTSNPDPIFIFRVKAVARAKGLGFEAGDIVYDNVVPLQFDEAGTKELVLDDCIPVESDVTVSEVYSGATYTLIAGDVEQTAPNTAAGATFEFTNAYYNSGIEGGSLNNSFTFVEDEDDPGKSQWKWVPSAQGGNGGE